MPPEGRRGPRACPAARAADHEQPLSLPLPLRETVGLSLGELASVSVAATADSALCFAARSSSTSLSLSMRKAARG